VGQPSGHRVAHFAARRRAWLAMGLSGLVLGFLAAATIAGGTAYLDSALAVGFAGMVLALIASTGARSPINAVLRSGPLAFYGRISYGLYMMHISVFIFIGSSTTQWTITATASQATSRWWHAFGCEHAGGRGALVRLRIADSQIEEAFLTRASQTRMHNRYDLRTAGSRPAAQLKGSFSMRRFT